MKHFFEDADEAIFSFSSKLRVHLLTCDEYRLTEAVNQEVFYKKGVLKSFAKFSGKHLCQSFFAGLQLY